jgi:hypothetical protein
MAVGVGVDQAGNDQAAAGVNDFRIGVRHCPGRDNVGDGIDFDDDVAWLAARRRDRMHQSACDHEHGNGPSGGRVAGSCRQRGNVADVNSRDRMADEWFASGYSAAVIAFTLSAANSGFAMNPIPHAYGCARPRDDAAARGADSNAKSPHGSMIETRPAVVEVSNEDPYLIAATTPLVRMVFVGATNGASTLG